MIYVSANRFLRMAAGTGKSRTVKRRTNAERSAQTRTQLIEGAIRSLRELGFARTTTATICRRARVMPRRGDA